MSEPRNEPLRKISAWDFACFCLKYLVDNGLGIILILATTFLGTAWVFTRGIDSQDKVKMFFGFVNSPFLLYSGWVVAVIEFLVFGIINKFVMKTHKEEMDRVTEVKNGVLQGSIPFELASSLRTNSNLNSQSK